jgi:hypothetical protein
VRDGERIEALSKLTTADTASEYGHSPSSFMTHVLTFSQLFERSFAETKKLLKTYILGALLLFTIMVVTRGIGAAFFAVSKVSIVADNLAVIVPVVLVGFIFSLASEVTKMLLNTFGLVLAVDRKKEIKAGIVKSSHYFWRLILGSIWMVLRSFVWIGIFAVPFLIIGMHERNVGVTLIGALIALAAIICGLYFLPRLAFINIIQLKEHTGVRKSADLSFHRTHGYWGKIVGNNLLMMLCVLLTSSALAAVYALVFFSLFFASQAMGNVVTAIIGLPLGLAGIVGAVVYFCGLTLCMQMYMVEIYETMKAHPRKTR